MIPLSDPVPLRQTTIWGSYSDVRVIPHRYGITYGELIQYDQRRTQFVWADHASEGIDDVLIDNVSAVGWSWKNTTDNTGHAITLVELAQGADIGVSVTAYGRGKKHPSTGVRIDNPATVLWDLLANVCGRPIAESDISEFAVTANQSDIRVAGSIDRLDTVQAIARDICASVGAIFCADALGLARIWPAETAQSVRAAVTDKHTVQSSSARSDIYNDLTVRFDFQGDTPRQTLQLQSLDSIAVYGLRSRILDAKWIASPRTAYDVGRRSLIQSARPQWAITASEIRSVLRVGDYVSLSNAASPVSGTHMVVSREMPIDSGTISIGLSVAIGAIPVITILQQSQAFDPQTYAAVAISTVGSDRILTVLDNDGSPLVNAAVTLDGIITRYSDTGGRVLFPASVMPVGEHTLTIVTQDGRTLTTTVLVQ